MPLHELIYVSLASRDMSEGELTQLLDQSRRNNEALGVSGMMIYHRREFMQLLEGERNVIEALFERIARDPRHQQIHKFWDGQIGQRNFETWTMAFVSIEGLDLSPRDGYASLLEKGLIASGNDTTGKKILLGLRDDFLQIP